MWALALALAFVCLLAGESHAARNQELVQTKFETVEHHRAELNSIAVDDENEAKCEAVVKGSQSAKVSNGLLGCKCIEDGDVIASEIGNPAIGYTLDNSSFEDGKVPDGKFRCMRETEKELRMAQNQLTTSIPQAMVMGGGSQGAVFQGIEKLAAALFQVGYAYGIRPDLPPWSGEENTHVEAFACAKAQRGLEAVTSLVDPGMLEKTLSLLDDLKFLLQTYTRRASMSIMKRAIQVRMAMLGIASDVKHRVSEELPEW